MARRLLPSTTAAIAAAAAVGACLNAAVAFADPSDSSTSGQSHSPARTAQHEVGSGAPSGHRGANLPGAHAALRTSQVGVTDAELSPTRAALTVPEVPETQTRAGLTVPELPQIRPAPLPSAQRSDGPSSSAARTVPKVAVPVSGVGAPANAAPVNAASIDPERAISPDGVDATGSGSTVPAHQVVYAMSTPAPTAAQPARTTSVATPVGQPEPPVTFLPAQQSKISVVPAPALASSIIVAVSRFLTSLSEALSGNTIPADTAVGMMSEVIRRGRFAPAIPSAVAAATTTSSTATAVEGEKLTLSRAGVGRVVSDKSASSGSALAITGNVTASATVSIPTGTTGLIIRAKSTGGPNMTLAVDGVAVTTLMVVASGYTDFTFAGVVPAGQHVISVASTTATSSATLYLDRISTMTGPIIDHFTGKSGSAPSDPLWGVRSGSGLDAGIQTYTTANVYVDGQSHLVIQAVRGKTAGTYTSGLVSSKNDVSYGYGTVTARIKVPKGQGLWPAFWMMGADSDTVGWPASGEIDVFEMPSTTTTVYSTLHGPIAGTTATQQAQIVSTMPDLSADYHNYWVRRLPNEVTFGIDDKTLGTMTPDSLGPGETWVYNRPMYVILNVAVGGPWAGAPDSSTAFPAKMLVDWVRWDPPA